MCHPIGVKLRQDTIYTKLECGVLIDAKTGEQVANPIQGNEDKVELAHQFACCRPGRM